MRAPLGQCSAAKAHSDRRFRHNEFRQTKLEKDEGALTSQKGKERRQPGRGSALLGRGGVEGGPLLLYFCSTTLWAFYAALFVLLERQDQRESLVTFGAKIFVMRHQSLLGSRLLLQS